MAEPVAGIVATATTPLADAKHRLSELVQSAQDTHERTIITKNGRPAAAPISIEDLESLEETLAVLSDHEPIAAIRAGEDAVAHGDLAPEAEVRANPARRRGGG